MEKTEMTVKLSRKDVYMQVENLEDIVVISQKNKIKCNQKGFEQDYIMIYLER